MNGNGVSPEQCSERTTTPEDQPRQQNTSRQQRINIDSDDDDAAEANKTKKRWTHDEQVILVSMLQNLF